MIELQEGEAFVWRGQQWGVTDRRILEIDEEDVGGSYEICLDQLGPFRVGGSWLEQIAGKTWSDIDDFATAYLIGCVMTGVEAPDIAAMIESAKAIKARQGM